MVASPALVASETIYFIPGTPLIERSKGINDDFIKDKDIKIFKHEPYFTTDHIHKKLSLIENWCKLYNLEYNNEFPHFKEIIPILMELQSRDWQPNEFVGFFSPRFFEKTGLEFNDIEKSYQKHKTVKTSYCSLRFCKRHIIG